MTDPEASKRSKGNVRRGKTAEQAVARYLREWWPNAVRAVRTASSAAADPGDIAGVPGVILSVKDCATAAWPRWWGEVDDMLAADPAALGVIVEKRRGWADPADWWVHLRLTDLVDLATGAETGPPGTERARITLATFARLLVDAGYARDPSAVGRVA